MADQYYGQSSQRMLLSSSSNSVLMKQESSRSAYAEKDVDEWTVDDVGDWLKWIQLDKYVTIFAQNEINGELLLDINLDDLDYMNVTILGHRKLILKGIYYVLFIMCFL